MSDVLESKRTPFVVGEKAMIMDEHLLPEAKVLYMYLGSNTESFKIIWDVLVKILGNDNKVRRAVAALKERGMLKIVSKKDPETKQFCGRKWIIYDYQPRTEEKPHVEKAARGNIHTRKKPHAAKSTDNKTNNCFKTKKDLKQTSQQNDQDAQAGIESNLNQEEIQEVQSELEQHNDPEIGLHPVVQKLMYACGIVKPLAIAQKQLWAEELCLRYGFRAVEQQAAWLPYRKDVKRPERFIEAALLNDYPEPELPPEVEEQQRKADARARYWGLLEDLETAPPDADRELINKLVGPLLKEAFERAMVAGRVNEGETLYHSRHEDSGVFIGWAIEYSRIGLRTINGYELAYIDWNGKQQDLEAVINEV